MHSRVLLRAFTLFSAAQILKTCHEIRAHFIPCPMWWAQRSLSFRRGTFANGENYRAEARSEAGDKASGHIMCYYCTLLSNKMFIYP